MEEIIVRSFKEYDDYTKRLQGDYYFRGQANSAWAVTPSIFREKDGSLIEKETFQKPFSLDKFDEIYSNLFLCSINASLVLDYVI